MFIIQMKPVEYFTPNREMDPAFSDELRNIRDQGVCLLAYDCIVEPDSMVVDSSVECRLYII